LPSAEEGRDETNTQIKGAKEMSNMRMRIATMKKVKAVIALLMLLISVAYVTQTGLAVKPPVIAVNPESTVDPTLTPGKNYTVSIDTNYKGADVMAYQFTLSYNPNVLHGVKVTNEDLIVGGSAKFKAGPFNNTAGKLSLIVGLFFDEGEVTSGPGTMATVTFTVVGYGTSNITLGPETRLYGWDDWDWKEYYIIDAKTMPDQIHQGFFANNEAGSSADGGATALAEGHIDRQASELQAQAETSLPTVHLVLPEHIFYIIPLPFFEHKTGFINFQRPLFDARIGRRFMLYRDIASCIKTELAKIGINVEIEYMDKWDWVEHISGHDYSRTWDEGGWDMAIGGWQAVPTDLLGYEGTYTDGSQPPNGANYYGWQNKDADTLLRMCMRTIDPGYREYYIWKWQKEFMRDPPQIPLYYTEAHEVTNVSLENWNPTLGWRNVSSLKVEGKTLEDDVTIRWGSCESLVNFNPLFPFNTASDNLVAQTFDTLMKIAKDEATGKYKVIPWLTSDYPNYLPPDGKTVTIPLRNDVYWHDGEHFDAEDVKFTFDTVCGFGPQPLGMQPFSSIIESVETSGSYTVVIHFNEPYVPYATLNSLLTTLYIIPEHIMRDVPLTWPDWLSHQTNWDHPMPGTGPFKFIRWVVDEYWLVEANKEYFRGEPMIDRIYNIIISNDISGLDALERHYIDFGDCWWADEDIIDDLKTRPDLKVWEYNTFRFDCVEFNLHHPILSNRYVRQAIAHAIPYEHIINTYLKNWGELGTPATGPVFPLHQDFYNTELQPYQYDLTKAQKYLDMWIYSLPENTGTPNPDPPPPYIPNPDLVALGPVGDGDFSGLVEMSDYVIWADRIVYGQNEPPEWPFTSGRPIDPDYDNNGYVDVDDFTDWRGVIGDTYP